MTFGRAFRAVAFGLAAVAAATLAQGHEAGKAAADDQAGLSERLRSAVEWLAAPEREGRGPGTKGIDQAAEWVAAQLAAAGLDTTVIGESPYQQIGRAHV